MNDANSSILADKIKHLSQMVSQRQSKPGDLVTDIPGLELHRREVVQRPANCFNKPILALTVQGAKRTIIGAQEYRYGAGNCLLAGIDMPTMSYQTEASAEEPYLVISLKLDSHLTSVLSAKLPAKNSHVVSAGATVLAADEELIDAFIRLLDLLDKPEQISLLAPVIIQEIHLTLLLGPHGDVLRAINTQGTHSFQVMQTIHWLREHHTEELDIEALAEQVHMAPSTFRKYFKAITSMSPTEYLQYLRLYEAQRLMLELKLDVTTASYQVGYESLSQFNREYKRLFGEAPMRNVQQLLAQQGEDAS